MLVYVTYVYSNTLLLHSKHIHRVFRSFCAIDHDVTILAAILNAILDSFKGINAILLQFGTSICLNTSFQQQVTLDIYDIF